MALFIRDDTVDALANELQKALKAPSKTEAVRTALKRELERTRQAMPLRKRVAKAQAMAAAMGSPDPDFSLKAYTDEMWDEI
ncbi:type II toxin-antitoxin system VapB family antitoxin [Rhizobium sp. Root482]|uniref:type II toxin-antitoxin system VapB family antitoxin n=1 Tax=Rhizobium sp. Root482 TaxID=1736543 RepID=UPI00070213F1|nr:type II toxin-antitoxin system VapB family antitoxin [Rhizobium sp. Root482]KQY14049.1 histidinol dehydrogenase [Rhizobium sp. Root482]